MKVKLLKTVNGRFIIRPSYFYSEICQISNLFRLVFNKIPTSYWWYWKYKLNPFGSVSFVCVKYPENIIISHAGALRVPLFLEGKKLFALQVVDCMTHPQFRAFPIKKRGVFALTMDLLFDNTVSTLTPYVFGFAGERHFLLGQKLLNYKRLSKVVEYTIFINKKRKSPVRNLTGNDFLKMVYERKLHIKDADFLRFCVFKTPDYLKWRYVDSPVKYKFVAIEDTCVVLKEENSEVRILDVLGLKYFKKVILELSAYIHKPLKLWLPEGHPLNREIEGIGEKNILEYVFACEKVFWEDLCMKKPSVPFFYSMGDSDLH